MTDIKTDRAVFSTRLGAIATTVGSAIGLGNIWRFPYEAGTHGGGAFMLCYIAFIFILGIPVICAEFILGRSSRSNIFGAFRTHSRGGLWPLTGYIGIIASMMILSFYSVVAGWTVEYTFQSAVGALDFSDATGYTEHFDTFVTGNWRPALWTIIFLSINFAILMGGVRKGIERFSNILMPVLFLLLIAFGINSLMMDGASDGLRFLFSPDFSALTPSTMLGAMGQAFFSLSLGVGTMLTYSSYFSTTTRLGRTALTTACLDTLVAILASVIIFPAVFTYGMSPSAGPTLVFEVLPSIFHHLPGGVIWSTLFFFLLFLASLTSTISMSEISIAFFTEELKMKRKSAVILNTSIAMVAGTLCALSFGCLEQMKIFGMTLFNLFDYTTSNIMLPFGGMIISIFVGWRLKRSRIEREMTCYGTTPFRVMGLFIFLLRWVCPIGIGLIFLNSIGII